MRVYASSNHPPILSLALLLLLALCNSGVEAFRKNRGRLLGQSLLPLGYTFEFTAPEYNVSLKENTRNHAFVQTNGGAKIGVFLPPVFSKIRYKIVDGDKDKLFVADHTVLGDFAFLQIRPEKGAILNREKKSHYELLVKATLRRKNANTLETTTKVNMRILDENDNNPMFKKVEYTAEIETNTPLNARVVRLEAFDADEGLNSELYYSMTNAANDSAASFFYVDARSGWIRTFAELQVGTYVIECFVEDRASRLRFHSLADSPPKPMFLRNRAKATVIVKRMAGEKPLRLTFEKKPLRLHSHTPQRAALIRVGNAEEGSVCISVPANLSNFWIEPAATVGAFWLVAGRTKDVAMDVMVVAEEVLLPRRRVEDALHLELDLNSRSIEFLEPEELGRLRANESLPKGFVLHRFRIRTAYDEDTDKIRFRLKSDDKSLPFHLDRNTGQLKLKQSLDFEAVKSYSFSVLVKLEDADAVHVEAPVTVTVVDSNDNCPRFVSVPKGHKLVLPSLKAKGTKRRSLFTFKATDADADDNGSVFYRLAEDVPHLEMDVVTGELSLTGTLKGTRPLVVRVVAFDAGTPFSLWTETEIALFDDETQAKTHKFAARTKDACSLPNLHTPKFTAAPEMVQIREDAPVGREVAVVAASDADVGVSGLVRFATDDQFFGVDAVSGQIFVQRRLQSFFDRTNKGHEFVDHKVLVQAFDLAEFVNSASPTRSITTTVTVRISDVNNFAPAFEQAVYSASVPENVGAGAELLRVTAVDRDPGQMGRVEYLLVGDSDLISVDPDTGAVRTEKSFDRELSPRTGDFHFLLAAFDRADPAQFDFANLTVHVTDVNDNAPTCPQEVQQFRMLEDSPRGHLLGCLVAEDADVGLNAALSFALAPAVPRAPFRVDGASGCLFLDAPNPLSAERHSHYNFNVTVRDQGEPSLATECRVEVHLVPVDRNAMPPEFNEIALEASVRENSPVGTEVVRVRAVDPEGRGVKYALVGGSGLGFFEIDADSGAISTSVVLDYEATPAYWLTVEALDTDPKPLSGYLSVLVRVLDQNDRAPVFEKPIYFASVEENAPPNKVVLKLEAEDVDGFLSDPSDNPVVYSIVRGNTQSLFHIDPNSGYLVTGKRKIDRETQREHELTVRACDRAPAPLCTDALVVVAVGDQNDNRPNFNSTTSLNVKVPAHRIGFLTRIFANDADEDGPNSEIEYSFVGPLVDERLRIDSFGRISTVEALKHGTQVHVTVLAKDHGEPRLNASITLILEAQGRARKSAANNKPPRFIEKETWKELEVSDSDPVGVIVGLVRAEDDDNDPLWFGITEDSQNPNETFAFKTATGELILARSVSLIDPSIHEVKLRVAVSDGVAEVTDTLTVKVSRSASAPRPQFAVSHDSFNIDAKAHVGSVLYRAKATFDEGRTGVSHPHRLLYALHHVDDAAARTSLRVDAHTGNLVLEKPLSPQVARNFTVIIGAKVGHSENFMQLAVTRETANEHAPRFVGSGLLRALALTNTSASAHVGTVKAFDGDRDDALAFAIVAGNELGLFHIDNGTGAISLTRPLPPTFSEAILTLRVSDSAVPPKSSTAVVKIVLPEADGVVRPVFLHESLSAVLQEESPVGRQVGQALLTASQGSLGSTFAFGTPCEFLQVHFVSGAVRLRKPLPAKNDSWMLNCTLFAVNEAGHNATIAVLVKILSTHAQAVVFGQSVYEAFVKESAPAGSAVYTDASENAPLLLSTLPSTSNKHKFRVLSPRESHFTVDGVSGALRLTQPLSYEQHSQWHFFVCASHLGRFPHLAAAPALVQVTVGNVNDETPHFLETSAGLIEMALVVPTVAGTRVGALEARDADGVSEVLSYGLSKNDPNGPFVVNRTTGEVFVRFNTSAELQQGKHVRLPVVVSDGEHSAYSTLQVNLIDAAVHAELPDQLRFAHAQYKVTVVEHTPTPTPRPLAVLRLQQALEAEVFRFELLTPRAGFHVHPTNGILFLRDGERVDREATPKLTLFVRATSQNDPTRSATCTVLVEVEDVNDSAPEFLLLPYHVVLSEDSAAGDRLISVKAKDDDLSLNGMLKYSLATDAPPYLDINKRDGRITLNAKPVGIRQGDSFAFTVIATDSGEPPLEARVPVAVSVVNRFQPIFSNARYTARVSESAAPGTTVHTVRATPKGDGVLGYRIAAGDDSRHFAIDFQSGTIKVERTLDREETSTFQLSVQAIDVTRPDVVGTCTVDIEVENVNDAPPTFDQTVYRFPVVESAAVGSLVGRVKAHDVEGSAVTYSIAEGNRSVVRIDPLTGQLHLAQSLDRETIDFYELTVLARDADRLSAEAVVQMDVLDANDVPPKFLDPRPLRLTLALRQLSPGTFLHKLQAADDDRVSSLTSGRRFKFALVDGDETLFAVDADSGILVVNALLDEAQLGQLAAPTGVVRRSLNVSVTDGLLFDFLPVHIEVRPPMDVLVGAPLHFEQTTYAAFVAENRPATNKSAVLVLEAKGGTQPYTYSLPGKSVAPVAVEADTGRVLLRETPSTHILELPVQVTDALGRRAFAKVKLSVRDENDKPPKFVAPADGYSLCVSTVAQESEPVAAVLAVDADRDDTVEYSLVAGEQAQQVFDVDPQTGHIALRLPLTELKPLPSELKFAVRASDAGNPPHTAQTAVRVKVVDVPHTVPQPNRLHYRFALSEDAASGTLVGVLQAETEQGRAVIFSVVSEEAVPFQLDPVGGQLTLKGALDRETVDRYYFVVEIRSKADKLHSFAIVTVTVMDVNDNAPEFSTVYDKIVVSESALVGSILATVVATDRDEGPNGDVKYYLEAESPEEAAFFKLDREYGWLTVAQALDREQRASFKLTVIAADDGGRNTSMPVEVVVTDVNDSPPHFNKARFTAQLARDAPVGSVVTKFKVEDADVNGDVQVFIANGDEHGLFKLGKSSVKLAKPLTAEDAKEFELKLVATDGAHLAEAVVAVSVQDTIDDAHASQTVQPLCPSKVESLSIAGNLLPGHIIASLPVSSATEVVFNHLLAAERLPFEIRNHTHLTVKQGYAKHRRYRLTVKSRRERTQPVTVEPSCLRELEVTVQNANTMTPKFGRRQYEVRVKENLNASNEQAHFLLRVEAVDGDFGDFGRLQYSLLNATGEPDLFALEKWTGAVLVRKPLDREQRDSYELFVQAVDGGGLSDTAKILVQVEDVNDNAPAFEKPVYRLKVLEDEVIGYELIQVKAIDDDPHDQIVFSLRENQTDAHFVTLDTASGVLRLARALDFEKRQSLSFEVVARDNGTPPLESVCTVEIEVLDVNDNPPRFEKTLYEATLMENVPLATKVVQVKAVDRDSEHFGKVSYSLTGDDAPFFDVDEQGWLLTTQPVDYETKKVLRVNVKAVDGGSPPLSDDTLVSVSVLDANDHAPAFAECPMEAVIQEGAMPGHVLLTNSISDDDSTAHAGPFKVTLRGEGAEKFAFDSDTRLIVTAKLVHAAQALYNLTATATDAGGLATECPVRVHVKRQSTHPPHIDNLLVTVNTLQGEFRGGVIGKVRATDKDPADMLRFALVENGASAKFAINPVSGEVTAQPDLLPGLHRLNVSVTDGKFTQFGRVDVDIANTDQDALDHSVSLRLKAVSATRFLQHFSRRFHETLAHLLGVPVTYVKILSIQEAEHSHHETNTLSNVAKESQTPVKPINAVVAVEVEKNPVVTVPPTQNTPAFTIGARTNRPHRKFFTSLTTGVEGHAIRHRRSKDPDLEILFTVSRGENHGYQRPPWVRQNVERQIGQLTTESGLEVLSLTSEVCRRDVCVKGECRDRVWLDNSDDQSVYEVDGSIFISPRHVRTFECLCRQGFAGRHCDVPVNMCSKDLCTKHEMCIPSDEEPSGFRCVCPPGFKGSQCAETTCEDASSCAQHAEISLMGSGYLQLLVANSMETRLELAFDVRTVSSNAVLMFGEGLHDWHSVRVANGSLEYAWDCGSGEAVARLPHVKVDDGNWHEVKVARRGRHVRLVLDNQHEADATSPAGSDVVNLFKQNTLLTFGARVSDPALFRNASIKLSAAEWFRQLSMGRGRQVAADLYPQVDSGMIGCLGKISFDGFELSKTAQGMRLVNAKIGCDTAAMSPCLSAPCDNGGQCRPGGQGTPFTCVCPPRYTGANCEIDLNACESRPCPNGIACHNLYNDFHCLCPPGFTGKTCQMRGDWDPCVTKPCGPYGSCVRQADTFMCNCSHGFLGTYCSERVPTLIDGAEIMSRRELIVILVLFVIAIILGCVFIWLCRRTNKRGLEKEKRNIYDDPTLANPLIGRAPPVPPHAGTHGSNMHTLTPISNAPPLPPRAGRQQLASGQHIYCNQANLPTVEVRPMLGGRYFASHSNRDSCSSPASSHGKKTHRYAASGTSSNSNLDCSRNYGSAADDLELLGKAPAPPPARTSSRDESSIFSSSRRASSSTGANGDVSSSAPLLSHNGRSALTDSIQCLPTTEEIEIDLDESDCDSLVDKQEMMADLRREQERLDTATSAWNDAHSVELEDEPQDYVTMKPIHKIKPFSVSRSFPDIDGETDSGSRENPPPPPAHRTQPKATKKSSTRTDTTKLYDNPNDDTLSNVTSNGLDD